MRTDGDEFALHLPGGRVVAAEHVVWRASTSGGPGGQHANRTASRVDVVLRIDELPLEPRQRALLYERLASRITGAGELTVSVGDHRSQHRNRKVALRRMERLIADALRESKRRIPTRESHGAVLRRRESKQRNSHRKRGRAGQWDEDG